LAVADPGLLWLMLPASGKSLPMSGIPNILIEQAHNSPGPGLSGKSRLKPSADFVADLPEKPSLFVEFGKMT